MKSQYCHLGVSSTTESGSFVDGKIAYAAVRGSSYKIERKGMPWRSGLWLIKTTRRHWLVNYDIHSNGKACAG